MISKIFKNGNSLAIRIPAFMHIGEAGTEVEIIRRNNTLVIQAREKSLSGLMERFAAFDTRFMSAGRELGCDQERDW